MKRSLVSKTPYETCHGKMSCLIHLCVFGCLAFVHVPIQKAMMLDYIATPGIFIGYSISTKQHFVNDKLRKMFHH